MYVNGVEIDEMKQECGEREISFSTQVMIFYEQPSIR